VKAKTELPVNIRSEAVKAMLAKHLVSVEMFAWLAALERLAELRTGWDPSDRIVRNTTRDESVPIMYELNTLAEKIVQQNGVSPRMIDEIAEWVNFDTDVGSDHHNEHVRDEAVKVLDKIATDSESQLRIGLVGIQGALQDGEIKIWAANKLVASQRQEATAPLRAELARWERGRVHSALSKALETLESIASRSSRSLGNSSSSG